MFHQLDLSDLIGMTRDDMLSVTVDIDPTKPEHQHNPPSYLIWLVHALKEAAESVPRDTTYAVHESAERVREFMEMEHPQGRGVAIFAAPGLWRTYVLPVPLPNRIRYGRPDVLPLLWAMDEYKSYAILTVDRERAQIIQVYLGRSVVVESKTLSLNVKDWRYATGRPPTQTRRFGVGVGRGSQHEKFEARVGDHLRRFWAETAEATARFLRESGINRLIIGGPEEAANAVRDAFPKASQGKVVGVIPLPLQPDSTEILDRAFSVALAEERRREADLIHAILDGTGAHGGVMGLARTLGALTEQLVQVLVAYRELEAQISQCPRCGMVTAQVTTTCPLCGNPMERTMVAQVLPLLARRNSAQLELVGREAASRLADGIGALLRYVPHDESLLSPN